MLDDQIAIANTLASLKAACDSAPEGVWKHTALKYYRAAERAHVARNTALTIIEIEAAAAALGNLASLPQLRRDQPGGDTRDYFSSGPL